MEVCEVINLLFTIITFLSDDRYDECALELDQCEQECIDTATGHVCSCHNGYRLKYDKYSCVPYCKEIFSSESGSFETPSWPDFYPNGLSCEWTIDLLGTVDDVNSTVVFSVDASAYGIAQNCAEEYIEFFDGIQYSSTSLGRFCGHNVPPPIVTTGLQARVVFHGSGQHTAGLQGVRVTYTTIQLGELQMIVDTCYDVLSCNTVFFMFSE